MLEIADAVQETWKYSFRKIKYEFYAENLFQASQSYPGKFPQFLALRICAFHFDTHFRQKVLNIR